ncbi:MAG: polysaccharide pyruvyl transferase family protein [Hungatella sp.]|nr:polysaccharide pyruvyl transferase family protein [Hungatella sp.]
MNDIPDKKAAIMTWHHTDNYGTGFQAYALSHVVKTMGYSVDLIDYRRLSELPLPMRTLYDLIKTGIIRMKPKRKNSKIYSNYKAFEHFYKTFFSYTKRCYSYQELSEISNFYGTIICGSDQIWSPDGFDERYFLDFVPNEKIVAYAPSFGISEIDNKNLSNRIGKLIKRFKYVSIREKTGCELASEISGRNDIVHVVDPVLLLEKKDWDKLKKNVSEMKTPYMIIFFLKNNEKYYKRALKEAQNRKLSPIILHCTQSEDNIYANIENPSPEELLSLIDKADFICTDSFHIAVLSIVYNKQFHVFLKDNSKSKLSRNSRLTDLFSSLQITNCVGNNFSRVQINYKKVNKRLEHLRKSSISYLKKALDSTGKYNSEYNVFTKCTIKNICNNDGIEADEFLNRKKNSTFIKRYLLERMDKWDFMLREECYGCQYYNNHGKLNYRRPLFYDALKRDFQKKSIADIYVNYYLAYDLPYLIKKIMKRQP